MNLKPEEMVIGSVLFEPAVIGDVIDLEADDFEEPGFSILWQGLKYLYEHDEPMELPAVVQMLQDAGRLDEVGGFMRLYDLQRSIISAANVKYYAEKVKNAATLRRLQYKAQEIQLKLEKAKPEDAEALIEEMEKAIESARPDDSKGLRHLSDVEEELFQSLDEKKSGIKTGFKLFDRFSGGLHPGWLYILAGRPSVGKTAKMLQMAFGVAKQRQGAVLIFSQEMSYTELMLRVLSNETSVPYNFLTKDKDKLTPEMREKLRERYKKLCQLDIYVDDVAGKSINQIKAAIKRFKARKGKIAAVFVDYLQIMNIKQELGESRAQAVGRVAQQAKEIARAENLTFVMLSQLSRKTEETVTPELGHLKESGGIEQAADVVEFLYENKEDEKGEPAPEGCKWVRSRIAKGRNIGLAEFICKFAGWCQSYEEIDQIGKRRDNKSHRREGVK
jgi:replicative DNA helicase